MSKPSETTGRTRLRRCACGKDKVQVVDAEDTVMLLLCKTCDAAAVEQIATAKT